MITTDVTRGSERSAVSLRLTDDFSWLDHVADFGLRATVCIHLDQLMMLDFKIVFIISLVVVRKSRLVLKINACGRPEIAGDTVPR